VLAFNSSAPRTVIAYGAFALIAGTAAVMAALDAQSAAGFFLASALAGSGFGAGFQGAMRTVLPTAKAHERAGVLSVVFVVSYLAMGIPRSLPASWSRTVARCLRPRSTSAW
jgi:hypothetical protein